MDVVEVLTDRIIELRAKGLKVGTCYIRLDVWDDEIIPNLRFCLAIDRECVPALLANGIKGYLYGVTIRTDRYVPTSILAEFEP